MRRAVALVLLAVPAGASAQAAPPLFATHDPLSVTLSADLPALRGDRRDSPRRPGTLTVRGPEGAPVDVPVEVRTRGAFRLDPSNCSFPPFRLDFGGGARGTVFEGQGDLKVVSSCRPGRDSYDRLVVLEYLAYRAYRLVTERSYDVRLLDLTLVDTSGASEPTTRVAFLIEEDEALARRLGGSVFDLEEGRNLPIGGFEPTSVLMTAIFEYMIGNPDWSAVAGQNVEIVEVGGAAIAVPYDFDSSGLVDAPYATPNPDFGLRSVRERYYRGWCAPAWTTGLVLERFRAARDEVLGLVDDATELPEETRARARRYLEEFFESIETDERAERRFLRDCRTPDL